MIFYLLIYDKLRLSCLENVSFIFTHIVSVIHGTSQTGLHYYIISLSFYYMTYFFPTGVQQRGRDFSSRYFPQT